MERKELFKMHGFLREQAGSKAEAIGDNIVDNMMLQMKSATEVELDMFVVTMLNANKDNFAFAYAVPQFDGFKKAMEMITNRYQVMDQLERGDLFVKIELMFKDMFLRKFAALGPETAELIAVRYAKQMIDHMKSVSVDPNNILAVSKEGAVY